MELSNWNSQNLKRPELIFNHRLDLAELKPNFKDKMTTTYSPNLTEALSMILLKIGLLDLLTFKNLDFNFTGSSMRKLIEKVTFTKFHTPVNIQTVQSHSRY